MLPKFTIEDHDRFNKLAGGMQSLVVVLAMCLGGAWTIYSFGSLNMLAKSKADLEKARADIEKTRAEVADLAQKKAVLETKITYSQVPRTATLPSNPYQLAVTVSIVNKGARDTRIRWTKATPLAVKALSGTKAVAAFHPITLSGEPPPDYTILAGGTVRLPFLVTVVDAGIYYLEFQAEVEGDKYQRDHAGLSSVNNTMVWTDSEIAVVQR